MLPMPPICTMMKDFSSGSEPISGSTPNTEPSIAPPTAASAALMMKAVT